MAMGLGDQDTAAVFEVLKKTIVTTPKSDRARSGIARLPAIPHCIKGTRDAIPAAKISDASQVDDVVIT